MVLLKKINTPFARLAIFVVYFWFGILKIIGTSPANPLVADLLHVTMPFMSWNIFIILFSIYEMIIGILFLTARFEKIAFALLIIHMIMTSLPLIFLPEISWQGILTPTLEGQYIIKNLVILALAIGIVSRKD